MGNPLAKITRRSDRMNMTNTKIKFDLLQMAMDAGMTENEFRVEIGQCYATYASLFPEQNPGQMISHTVNYPDHDVVIEARRTPPIKVISTLN